MPGASPSGPLDASSTVRGLINTLAQAFAGAKTFLGLIVASAGIQVGSLFNTNGTGASDIAVKLGTSTSDASTNVAARLLSLRTGLNGGSEVESLGFYKGGLIAGGNGFLTLSGAVGARLSFNGAFMGCNEFVANQNAIRSSLGANAGEVGNVIGFNTADASVNATSKLVGFATGIGGTYTEKSFVTGRGTYGISGSIPDASGTPGSVTQNAPKGRAAIANAATSVTITNDQVTTDSFVAVEWEQDPAQRHTVTVAAGSFTVTLSAAAAANRTFRYSVVR